MALIGHVDYISRSFVQGWAFDTDRPSQPARLAIRVNGVVHTECVADRPRAGLHQATLGKAPDDREFRVDFEPPLSVFNRQDIEVLSVDTQQPLPDGRRIIAAPSLAPAGPATIKPLLLTSTGRSGSTMLMNEFRGHPDIVLANRYPFEIKQIAYHAAAFRALVLDADRTRSTHPETMLSHKLRMIGSNPYYSPGFFDLAQPPSVLEAFYETEVPNAYAALFRRLILRYYELLAASDNKASAPYFCEKGDISKTCRDAARLFCGPVSEVVLVRDPRALLSSAIAFWKIPPYEALDMLRTTVPQLEDACNAAGSDTIVVRYEDLVLHPRESRRRMSTFLGIDLERGAHAVDVSSGHRTSTDPLASLSRWSEDLPADLIAACERSFAGFMERFGYTGAPATRPAAPAEIACCAGGSLRVVTDDAAATKSVLGRQGFPVLQGRPGTTLFGHTFGKQGTGNFLLGDGWSALEDGAVWSRQTECSLTLTGADAPGRYEIQLCLAPFTHGTALPVQRLALVCCEADLGTVSLNDLSIVSGEIELSRVPADRTLPLTLRLPDASSPAVVKGGQDTRLLGVSLRRIALTRMASPASPAHVQTEIVVHEPVAEFAGLRSVPGCGAPPPDGNQAPAGIDREAARRIMYRFESLGENCEFGLLQRKLGAEPPGLLRFASAPIDKLIPALTARFEGMGMPDQLEIERAAQEYMVFDKMFGIRYHAWVKLGEKEPAAIVRDEVARLPLLIDKLREDLSAGQKIFVFHGMRPLSLQQAGALSAALYRYGPSTLLWVELADDMNAPGSVTELGPHLLKGHIDRFAPGENAHDFSLPVWLQICSKALELRP
jgi:hypothetical protein